jgi:hypothetical protein
MKYPFVLTALLAVALLSTRCGDPVVEESVKDPKTNETFAQRMKREIEAKLKISGTEKYTSRTYYAYINGDTIKDVLITVNRMEFAMDEAIKSGQTAKAEEMGYVGPYNFFFYYDGALDLLSDPVPVPSSPGRELDVTFTPITSPTKQDIIIDYRIRNSGWRSYFTSSGEGTLSLMFQWKWFDYVGEDTPEALNHVLEDNPEGIGRDIAIYQSSIDHYSKEVGDIYKYQPEITQKGALVYRFFFDPRVGKYRLYSDAMLKEMGLHAIGEKGR